MRVGNGYGQKSRERGGDDAGDRYGNPLLRQALAGVIREQGMAEMQAIGAGALNQAIKAIAIARGFVAPSGIDLVCVPAFVDVEIDGAGKTASS